MRNKFTLALAQISCERANKKKNLRKMAEVVTKAKNSGAQLVIFPELSLTGYVVRDRIYELAETIPGPSTSFMEKITKKTGMHVVFGMPEKSEKTQATLHNAAVLMGPNGLIGKHRKMYLPTHSVFEEKRYFRVGYQADAFDTPLGKIGLIICYDVYFPEVTRLVRMKGAQLIVCISASPGVRRSFFEILTAARAIENTSFFAFVNLVGVEDGLQFWGGSRLIGPDGKVVAQCKYDAEDFAICEIDYSQILPVETFVPTLRDLRPEIFDELKQTTQEL